MAGEIAAKSCVAAHYSPWIGININPSPGFHKEFLEKQDVVQVAAQLGRLDFLTGVLASLAIFLTISALIGFWVLRGSAIRAARKAAEEEIRQELPKLAPTLIADELRKRPELIAEAIKNDLSLVSAIAEVYKTMYGSMSGDVPQNVISSLDEGDENGNGAR